MKPVLFVTGHAPPYRVGAFAALHQREGIEVALFGGRSLHGRNDAPASPRAASCRFHTDTCTSTSWHDWRRAAPTARSCASTGGRVALPATWAGARRAGAPLVLWASLWAHPRSAPHLLSYAALRRLYGSADAIVTYGPHVSAYVRARGARNVHVAPQSVDNAFWSAPVTTRPAGPEWPGAARVKFMFAGRPDREKGTETLIRAWQRSDLHNASSAALVLVGVGSSPPWVPPGGAVGSSPESAASQRTGARSRRRARASRPAGSSAGMPGSATPGVSCIGPVPAKQLREMYADADVLVVPSIRTRTFREPWGLVVNEAMNRGLATIATDAVGAVAGGLVRDGHNGLVVPAGDSDALAEAMVRLAGDGELRARLGAAGAADVGAYTHEAWARGFSEALATVGLSRTRC